MAKYTEARVRKICDAIASGETDKKAAAIGGIGLDTFYRWQREKSYFSESIKKAREDFEEWQLHGILDDAKKSLKDIILGYDYEEVKTEYKPGPDGQPAIVKQTRTTKKIPPNATALIFALCNRDPEHWQNKVAQDVTGKIDVEKKGGVSLANVPDELLAQVIEAISKK